MNSGYFISRNKRSYLKVTENFINMWKFENKMRNLFLIRDASFNKDGYLTESYGNGGKHKVEQIVKQMHDIIDEQMQKISYKKSKNGLYLLYSPEIVTKQTAEIIKDSFELKKESFNEEDDLWIDVKYSLKNAKNIDNIIKSYDDYFSIVVCAHNNFITHYKNHIIKTKSIKGERFKIENNRPGIHFDLKFLTYKILFG